MISRFFRTQSAPMSQDRTRSVRPRENSVTTQTRLHRWCCSLVMIACAFPVFLQAKAHKHKTIVVISLDGFPAYALDYPCLPIPTLRMLARDGVAAASMQPVNPTVTWPNHTALVTGVDASKHHV